MSAFLDSAPAYLAFFSVAKNSAPGGFDAGTVAALSVATVMFGAATYLGNAPNLMVKAIADEQKIPAPSFLGTCLNGLCPSCCLCYSCSGWCFFGNGCDWFTIFYSLFFFWCSAPWYFLKMWRRGDWRAGFWQRFGRYEPEITAALDGRPILWLHAVSVGEVGICLQLIRVLGPRSAGIPNGRFHHDLDGHGGTAAQVAALDPAFLLSG